LKYGAVYISYVPGLTSASLM